MKIITITVEELNQILDERLKNALTDLVQKLDNRPMQVISRLDIAKKFGKSPETIDSWERQGFLPPAVKMGSKKYYILEEVEELIKSNR